MVLRLPSIDLSALRLPETLADPGLLVGWSLEFESPKRAMGFQFGDPDKTPRTGYVDPIQLSREGHLMTLAPTGAGKGVGCIIPALLKHDGPVIVIDPKGENAAVTARRRREMGQQVIVLDPMAVTGFATDRLNPLDAIDIESPMAVDDTVAIVDSLWSSSSVEPKDLFWVSRAKHLVTALILHVLVSEPPERRNLSRVRELTAETVAANRSGGESGTSSLLDAMRDSPHPEVRLIVEGVLSPAKETFGGIVSFAQELLDFLRGPVLADVTSKSSFSLDAVTRGDPLSIYVVLPPHMLESHGRLLRLWVSALIAAVTRRRGRPEKSTLFILDEAAQLGTLPQLRQAITLLRGYGLQTWSFWQDRSQLVRLYPDDWHTMINNCRVLQCFGLLNMNAARDVASLTGFDDPESVLDLKPDEMVLQLAGDEAVIARLPNYLTDPPFVGMFDDNPFYRSGGDVMPKPHPMGKVFSRGGDWQRSHNLQLDVRLTRKPERDPDVLLKRLLGEGKRSQLKK